MSCPYCGFANADGKAFCPECGKPQPVYAAPDGFSFDRESGRYQKSELLPTEDGGQQRVLTWFDPVSGEYIQEREEPVSSAPPEIDLSVFDPPESDLPEEPPAPEPLPELPLDPEPTAEPLAAPPLPEGFSHDPASGLAYRVDTWLETPMGPVVGMTWYDPAAMAYAQVRYRPAVAAPAIARPMASSPSAPAPAVPTPPAKKATRHLKWIIPVAAALCILVGVGIWGAIAGWLPFFGSSGDPDGQLATTELPSASPSPSPTDSATPSPSEQPGLRADGTIAWADSVIEAAVRQHLGLAEGAIRPDQLRDLYSVSLLDDIIQMNSGVYDGYPQSLLDLRHFPNLEAVQIVDRERDGQRLLDSLGPIQTLTELHVTESGIRDLSAVEGFPELRFLNADDNQISDLGPLASARQLSSLILSDNPVSNLEPLRGLSKLQQLDLDDTAVNDWSPVEHVASVEGRPDPTTSPSAAPDEAEEADREREAAELDGIPVVGRPEQNLPLEGVVHGTYRVPTKWHEEKGHGGLESILWIYGDNYCEFEVNLGAGAGLITGYCSSDGKTLTIEVLDISYFGFRGDDLTKLVFSIDAEGRGLTLGDTEAGLVNSGTPFVLTEQYEPY